MFFGGYMGNIQSIYVENDRHYVGLKTKKGA
jgi:hypothetical protein